MPGFANGTPLGTVRQILNNTGLCKNNFSAGRAPLATDDATQGYEIGSRWVWQGQEWVVCDATAGAAVWVSTTASGSGGGPYQISDITGLQAALDDKLPAREQRKVLAADATVTGTTFANSGLSFTIEAEAAYHVFLIGRVSSDTATSGGAVILVGPADCTENGIAWIPNTNGANGQFIQQRFANGSGPPIASTGVGTINNSYPIVGDWIVVAGATAGTVQLQIQAEEAAATFRLYANSWLIARKLESS